MRIIRHNHTLLVVFRDIFNVRYEETKYFKPMFLINAFTDRNDTFKLCSLHETEFF